MGRISNLIFFSTNLPVHPWKEFIKMQVVKMLEDLKTEVTEEGTAEEANYQKFAEFCSTTQKKKTVT